MKAFWIYYLAIKYWTQGDSWEDALQYAEHIVMGFNKKGNE